MIKKLMIGFVATLLLGTLAIVPAGSKVHAAEETVEKQLSDAVSLESDTGEKLEVLAQVTDSVIYETTEEEYREQKIQFNTNNIIELENSDSDLLSKITPFFFDTAQATSQGNLSKSDWDSSKGVKGTVNIAYKKNKAGEYLITRISGGYTRQDSSITVIRQNVLAACSSGKGIQEKRYAPGTKSNWSFDTGFNKYIANSMYAVGGGKVEIHLQRKSSKWTLTVNNILFQSGAMPIK